MCFIVHPFDVSLSESNEPSSRNCPTFLKTEVHDDVTLLRPILPAKPEQQKTSKAESEENKKSEGNLPVVSPSLTPSTLSGNCENIT